MENNALLNAEQAFGSDQILKVTNLRLVNGRVVGFRDNSVPEREPDPAGSGIGGPDTVFASMGPSRFDAGLSKGHALPPKLCHRRTSLWISPGGYLRSGTGPFPVWSNSRIGRAEEVFAGEHAPARSVLWSRSGPSSII